MFSTLESDFSAIYECDKMSSSSENLRYFVSLRKCSRINFLMSRSTFESFSEKLVYLAFSQNIFEFSLKFIIEGFSSLNFNKYQCQSCLELFTLPSSISNFILKSSKHPFTVSTLSSADMRIMLSDKIRRLSPFILNTITELKIAQTTS